MPARKIEHCFSVRVSGELLILDTDLASASLRKSTLHIASPVISLLVPLLPASAQSPTTPPTASIRTTAATFPSRSPDAIALDEASALRPTGADTKLYSEQHIFDETSAAHLIARRVRRSAQQQACMPPTRYAADSRLLADPCRCTPSHAQSTNAASARQQTHPITTVDPSPSHPPPTLSGRAKATAAGCSSRRKYYPVCSGFPPPRPRPRPDMRYACPSNFSTRQKQANETFFSVANPRTNSFLCQPKDQTQPANRGRGEMEAEP
jgi:hypothetical protein